MASLNVFMYIMITLVWMALTAFLIFRMPKCTTIPKSGKIFVIVFLVLQLFVNGQQLYEILVKENIIYQTASKNNVVTDKNTLTKISKLLISNQWFIMLSLCLTIGLYYILFNAIFQCNDKVISKQLIWAFLLTTVVQYLVVSTIKVTTENKLLLSAMAN